MGDAAATNGKVASHRSLQANGWQHGVFGSDVRAQMVGGGENGLQLLSKLDTGAVENIRSTPPPSNVMPLSPFLKKLIARRDATPPGSTPPSVPRPPDAA